LAQRLSSLPVEVHWPRTESDAIGLAAAGRLQLGIVDDALWQAGGLDLLGRLRQMGIDLPCLLVSEEPTQRILARALELEVLTVIRAAAYRETLWPAVIDAFQRIGAVDIATAHWRN
jgi:hypothetical protein